MPQTCLWFSLQCSQPIQQLRSRCKDDTGQAATPLSESLRPVWSTEGKNLLGLPICKASCPKSSICYRGMSGEMNSAMWPERKPKYLQWVFPDEWGTMNIPGSLTAMFGVPLGGLSRPELHPLQCLFFITEENTRFLSFFVRLALCLLGRLGC